MDKNKSLLSVMYVSFVRRLVLIPEYWWQQQQQQWKICFETKSIGMKALEQQIAFVDCQSFSVVWIFDIILEC